MKDRVFYICNGHDPKCISYFCHRNGGTCHHTENPEYALNGPENDPESSERFEKEIIPENKYRTVTYYWERNDKSNAV